MSGGQTTRAEGESAGAAHAVLGHDQRAAGGAAIAFAGRRVAEDHAAVGALRRAIGYLVLAFRAMQDKRRAALRADQRVRLQGCTAGGTALACAVRADIGDVGHRLTAVWARLEFFLEG